MENYQDQVNRFTTVYAPLTETFVKDIAGVDTVGMPEPFFPVFGRNYASAETKIAFVGMETRGYGEMRNFMTDAEESIAKALLREQSEFDDFAFTEWTTNFGMDFWSFVMKFLAAFHKVPDWKTVKQGERPEILSSFAWANINTIERYEVTAKNKGVKQENWDLVKRASAAIDRGENILRALNPQLVVICHWDCDEKWLTDGLVVEERTDIGDHLLYMKLQPTGTHVVWTAHPTWLKFNDFDGYVARCVELAKSKLAQ